MITVVEPLFNWLYYLEVVDTFLDGEDFLITASILIVTNVVWSRGSSRVANRKIKSDW